MGTAENLTQDFCDKSGEIDFIPKTIVSEKKRLTYKYFQALRKDSALEGWVENVLFKSEIVRSRTTDKESEKQHDES